MNNKKRKEKIKCICLTCGKEFFVLPCIIKKGWGKYCSTVCSQNGNPDEHHPNWNGGLKESKKRYNIKMRQNPKYVISRRMSLGMRRSLKNGKGNKSWTTFVNYSIDDLFNRLNKTLPNGYLWNDFLDGKLHIDHIIPISVFNYSSPKHLDFKRAWALDNLQLLPAKENMSKQDKLYKPFQTSLEI